jgi:hypothetical protein
VPARYQFVSGVVRGLERLEDNFVGRRSMTQSVSDPIQMVDLHRSRPGKDNKYDVWVLFTESDGYQWVLHKSMLCSATQTDRPELVHSAVIEVGAFLRSDAEPAVKRNLQRAVKQISKSR